MRRVNVLVSQLLLLAGLMVGVNGQAFGETDTEMIVGGTAAPDGKYPWQVRLYSNMDDTIGFCGGSIIAPQWVLTAGHCLIDSDAVVVGYGSNDRTKTKKIESEKIIVHPGYIAGEKADLALVKLKQPIPDAAAISFADAAKEQALISAGATVTVTGWGAIWDFQAFQNAVDVMAGRKSVSEKKLLTNEELEAPRKLHEVDIEVIDPKECKASLRIAPGPGFRRRRHRDLRHGPDRRQGFLLRRQRRPADRGRQGQRQGLHPGRHRQLGAAMRQPVVPRRLYPRVVLFRLDRDEFEGQLAGKAASRLRRRRADALRRRGYVPGSSTRAGGRRAGLATLRSAEARCRARARQDSNCSSTSARSRPPRLRMP